MARGKGEASNHLRVEVSTRRSPSDRLCIVADSDLRRYSDEFKYRPAASPVITEHLPDGRIRLRGASPAGVGVDANSLPKTPQQLAKERQAAQEEALENAKRQLGIKTRKKKEKSNLEALMAQGIPMAGRDAGVGLSLIHI